MILVKRKVIINPMDEEALLGYYETIKDVIECVNEKYEMYKDEEFVDKIINIGQLEEILYVFESMFASVSGKKCERDFFINLQCILIGPTATINAYDTITHNVLIIEFDERKIYIQDKVYTLQYAYENQGVYFCDEESVILTVDIKKIKDVYILHFSGDAQAIWCPSWE